MRLQFYACSLAAVALAGCGKAPSVKTFPVSGIVTYEGKPLDAATVTYATKDGYSASGKTDQDGKFSLSTYVSPKEVYRGAVPGDYRVTIEKKTAEAQRATADLSNYGSLSDEERAGMMAKMWNDENDGGKRQTAAPKSNSEIPLKYADPATSGLSATVVVGENETREFKLHDD